MGSSWHLVCCSTFVLVLLSSASGDEPKCEQREITDFGQAILQRPLDLKDLLKGGFIPEITPRGSQPSFDPSSFKEQYPVKFPLGRPTSDNLEAICLYGDRRPRYPDSYFPRSGFGSEMRRGKAVNEAESFFSTCCEGRQTWELEVTLCCTTQAWELSIESFCNEEFSIKTSHYSCCRLNGRNRLNCFHNNAPNPNYEPTEEIPVPPLPSTTTDKFVFDPNTCQREMKSSTSQRIVISFPPGRPTADTIKSLCHNQMFRPLYNVKCLLDSGYKLLAHQAKTINHMEKGFEQCCKKQGMLDCADQKWREEINKFCLGKKGRRVDVPCCLADRTNDRYNCFQQNSPDPYYNMTSANRELSLNKICDAQKIIKKMFPLQSFMDQCCPLSDQDETVCSVQKLEEMLGSMCSSRREGRSYPAVRRCCCGPAQETLQCMSKTLKSLFRQKKKKCPIS
ncbi:extracellular matrix protein 1-like [Channa argus]|uniref:extracellular matrix protein 1-like n=1 Tax=Channa argus TaxID=215402 RepID=UPI0029469CB5|nr:hypothetical protein Q8A73_007947 [Channa argus]